MGKRKFAKDPLLYIQQPTAGTAKAPMQDHYRTPKKPTASEIPPEKNPQEKPRTIKRKTYGLSEGRQVKNEQPGQHTMDGQKDEIVSAETADNSAPDELEEKKSTTDRPKFKDMTIEEKVEYFVSRPRHVPKLRCQIETNERKYRGIITDFQENHVFIRVGKRSSSTKISLDQITNIGMLGF